MARLVFIRHAHSTANDAGILSGQLPGISLSKKGKKQAELLVDRLGSSHFDSIRVSPMQRCEETIAPWLKSGYSRGLKSYEIDEALIEVSLDLSGRAFVAWNVELPECLPLGNPAFDPSLAEHAVSSLANSAAITLHVNLRAGRNVHHIIEATFKGLARCLRDAVRVDSAGVPSTKGVLS